MSTAAGAAAATEVSESFLHRASRVPIIGVWFNPYAWGSIFYFTTVGFAFALGVFVWITTMGSLSLGLLPFFLLGLPLLVLLLGSVRGLSLLHGSLCQLFLGVRMPRRTLPIYTTRGISLWQRILCWLRDLRSWLSLAYLLGNFPVSLALFVLFVVLTPVCAVMLGLPVITLFNGSALYFETGSEAPINLPGMALIPDASGRVTLNSVQLLLLFSLGLISTTCVLWLARGLGWVYGHVVQAIQVARPRAVRPRTAA